MPSADLTAEEVFYIAPNRLYNLSRGEGGLTRVRMGVISVKMGSISVQMVRISVQTSSGSLPASLETTRVWNNVQSAHVYPEGPPPAMKITQ